MENAKMSNNAKLLLFMTKLQEANPNNKDKLIKSIMKEVDLSISAFPAKWNGRSRKKGKTGYNVFVGQEMNNIDNSLEFAERVNIAAKLWKALSAEEKEKYNVLAKEFNANKSGSESGSGSDSDSDSKKEKKTKKKAKKVEEPVEEPVVEKEKKAKKEEPVDKPVDKPVVEKKKEKKAKKEEEPVDKPVVEKKKKEKEEPVAKKEKAKKEEKPVEKAKTKNSKKEEKPVEKAKTKNSKKNVSDDDDNESLF